MRPNQRLRKRYWREYQINLDEPRFLMVELFPKDIAERPPSLVFAESWRVELVLDAGL